MDRQDAMKKLMEADFAVYELILFLDTHPEDNAALDKYTEAVKYAAQVREEFEKNFGPITATSAAGKKPWQWTVSPWTWQ